MQVWMLLNLCTSHYNYAAACNSPNLIAGIGPQLNSEYNAK